MKVVVFRIGDSEDDCGEAGGAGVEEFSSDGLECGATGHDVVDDDEVFVVDGEGAEEFEGAADVVVACFLGSELSLSGGIADAFDGAYDSEVSVPGEASCDDIGLVVAA